MHTLCHRPNMPRTTWHTLPHFCTYHAPHPNACPCQIMSKHNTRQTPQKSPYADNQRGLSVCYYPAVLITAERKHGPPRAMLQACRSGALCVRCVFVAYAVHTHAKHTAIALEPTHQTMIVHLPHVTLAPYRRTLSRPLCDRGRIHTKGGRYLFPALQ